jgi:hypothetical protein
VRLDAVLDHYAMRYRNALRTGSRPNTGWANQSTCAFRARVGRYGTSEMAKRETRAAILHPISVLVKRLELRTEVLVQNAWT